MHSVCMEWYSCDWGRRGCSANVAQLGGDAAANREDPFPNNFHAYGIVQKEYVDVPDGLLEDTEQLGTWFALSHAFVSSLRPKPTTRRSTGAS